MAQLVFTSAREGCLYLGTVGVEVRFGSEPSCKIFKRLFFLNNLDLFWALVQSISFEYSSSTCVDSMPRPRKLFLHGDWTPAGELQ